ncbi:branched-chain amino acid ABC transporter substrate-binding protein [Rhodopseudomonas palustris]|uniref:Branched-chain amino acid ABC transporter substrate-binding protein n=1 Tax=Rhodopseudomonas palustris TaxID=1076 RepID=A0A323UBB5_RHOPL|nr:ABC transporter substrate-binding protein [Rhodopseudomonas palustris]PZA09671.1 branched-chain amino acid ABC transporter substrate-binding protein [Rhodopseudomonas palustris]
MSSLSFCRTRRRALLVLSAAALTLASPALADSAAGSDDRVIRIGNLMPYSGPASAYSIVGRIEQAYFKMINDQGGINGRRIEFISYDDAYNPAKAVEQVRKLVERDQVLLVFSAMGTPTNAAIQKYLNLKQVPQLFAATGATRFGDPTAFPWTMGWQPPYQSEGRVYAKYILAIRPQGRIAVLYQNDDLGRDLLKGLKDGLGGHAAMIALEESYEVAEPSADNHIARMKASGADVFVSITTPKFAAQSIKAAAALDWHPLYVQALVSASIAAVLRPAGLDASQGLVSAAYNKDAADPQWRDDAGMQRFHAFLDAYAPDVDRGDNSVVYGYGAAQCLVEVLRRAGDDLSRTNIMKQAASLQGYAPDTLLPGITVNTAADDFHPIEQLRMMRFSGDHWELFGPVIDGRLRD